MSKLKPELHPRPAPGFDGCAKRHLRIKRRSMPADKLCCTNLRVNEVELPLLSSTQRV